MTQGGLPCITHYTEGALAQKDTLVDGGKKHFFEWCALTVRLVFFVDFFCFCFSDESRFRVIIFYGALHTAC